MNKAQQYSVMRISQAIAIIEELAPQEQKREAIARRKHMERAYKSLSIHADRLDIQMPELSTFYYPEQYLEHARLVAHQMKERQLTSKLSANQDIQQLSLPYLLEARS